MVAPARFSILTTDASARTVCNQWGRCWHVSDYGYRGSYYHSDYDDWRYRHRYRDYDHDRDYWRYHHHHDYDRDYDRDHDRY